jgi:beta-N-acetylhexosaminidase
MGRKAVRALCAALAMGLVLSAAVTASAKNDQIEKIVAGMSLSEKVGQMFLAVCPTDALGAVKTYQPGGYVLFARDFADETPASVKKKTASWQRASKVPMLIAVDEEGGNVTRVSRYKAFRSGKFLSSQAVYKAGGADAIRKDIREKADLLLALGINVNLAPVADVPTSAKSYIYDRSFGTDPSLTAKYVSAVVVESKKAGIGAVLKHFPGHGDNGDTHTGIVVDDRPLSSFEKRDFLPFRAGIEAGAQAVLVSHNIVTALDRKYPSSLSPKALKALRNLGFHGVAMTDDLAMGAIAKAYGQSDAAVLAVEAGNDMLISADFKSGISAVLKAVKSGRISEARIDQSVRRILKWKRQLGLI